MYNAIRFASIIGSEYFFGGRSLNDLCKEVRREPFEDAIEEIIDATNKVKVVSWEVVRNICNVMTNQLYLGGPDVDISQAHMATSSFGIREWTLEPGQTGTFRPAGCWGWWAFDETDVSRLLLVSGTSGSGIEAMKKSPGIWELRFIPSPSDPAYRGCYYSLFTKPEGVENIDPEYVKGNHR